MGEINKARFWVGVLYPENMKDDWEVDIGDIVQLPFAYANHNRCLDGSGQPRKEHIHLMLAFPNTTTYAHAMNVFNLLSADKQQACNTIQAVVNVRNMYDYLIHDTETCRKKNKTQYSPAERVTGNNFDIGAYEQLSNADRMAMRNELFSAIFENKINNMFELYAYIVATYKDDCDRYLDIYSAYNGPLERLTRGVYQSFGNSSPTVSVTELPTRYQHATNTEICCPDCGSLDVEKYGKTASLSQRWRCKDCGKTFI